MLVVALCAAENVDCEGYINSRRSYPDMWLAPLSIIYSLATTSPPRLPTI